MAFDTLQRSFHRFKQAPTVGRLMEGVVDLIGVGRRRRRTVEGFQSSFERGFEDPVERGVGNGVVVVVESSHVTMASRKNNFFHPVPSSLFPSLNGR